jgi:c-di-AMP phosphodiesterase-like protein
MGHTFHDMVALGSVVSMATIITTVCNINFYVVTTVNTGTIVLPTSQLCIPQTLLLPTAGD